MTDNGICTHECIIPGCGLRVAFIDEPWCSTHYPDNGFYTRKSTARTTASRSSTHKYISTACYHTLHTKCRMTCKFCESKCACLCHNREEN
jgi:hypothetical protein